MAESEGELKSLLMKVHLGTDGADMLNEAKLGILCGTIASALVGILMLNHTLPKAPKN